MQLGEGNGRGKEYAGFFFGLISGFCKYWQELLVT